MSVCKEGYLLGIKNVRQVSVLVWICLIMLLVGNSMSFKSISEGGDQSDGTAERSLLS